jgi:hypothetical protein
MGWGEPLAQPLLVCVEVTPDEHRALLAEATLHAVTIEDLVHGLVVGTYRREAP